jgi:hypothetical protein
MRYLIIVLSLFLITCGGGGSGSPTSSDENSGGDNSGGGETSPNIVVTNFSFSPGDCSSCSTATQVTSAGQNCGSCSSCTKLAFSFNVYNSGNATANTVRLRFRAQYGVFTNISTGSRTTYTDNIYVNNLSAGSSASGTIVIEDYFDYSGGALVTWTNPVVTLTDLQVN